MSTKTHSDDPRTPLPPSVVILGNDAQLAARPATPVQLAHACLAAGYRAVVPASWGDELIASATMQALDAQEARPAIHCACPHVARRVLAVGADLSPYLVSLVSPPVAAARYVRRYAIDGVRVTYVGRCPGAGDDSIDARLTPEELLAQLAERGISLAEQPFVFESVIPPDRRRHRSQPGGLPAPEALWSDTRPTTVEAISEDDLVSEIAEKVLSATNSLLDLAPALGCVCAGALVGTLPHRARAEIVALEPPRSPSPVVDEAFAAGLQLPLPVIARSPLDIIVPTEREAEPRWEPVAPLPPLPDVPAGEPVPARRPRFTPTESEAPAVVPRRRPNAPASRAAAGSMPVASDSEGRVLPRAYVARRRSPRSGIPVLPDVATRATPEPSPSPVLPSAPARERDPVTAAAPASGVSRGEMASPDSRPMPHGEVQRSAPRSTQPIFVETSALRTEHTSASPMSAVLSPSPIAHAPAAKALDAELPIAQSVEPTVGTNGRRHVGVQTLPVLVDQVRRTSERISGGVRAIATRSPRTMLAVAVAAFVLLGIAIGYAAAHRGTGQTTSAEGGRLDDARAPAVNPAIVADSLRGGAGRRDSAPRQPGAGPGRRGAAVVRQQGRGGRIRSGAAGVATPVPDSAPVSTPPGAGTASDSAAAVQSRDSAARAATLAATRARADSLTAERAALSGELERRRARLDSIARRVQGLKPQQR